MYASSARSAVGSLYQRVAAVFAPVRTCVEVLGAHTDAGAAQRLLAMCCKAVTGAKNNWQVCSNKLGPNYDTVESGRYSNAVWLFFLLPKL